MAQLQVLMITSEAAPFAKSGGLADVLGSLPSALQSAGVDVRIFMPEYRRTFLKYSGRSEFIGTVSVPAADGPQTASLRRLVTPKGVTVYFLGHEGYFHRSGMYGTLAGDFSDNDERFIFFCRAVFESLKLLNWKPDILHAHDWQTGLVPVFLHRLYGGLPFFEGIRTVMTIHNLAYQGRFPSSRFPLTGLPWSDFVPEALEFYGETNFLKGGIVFADAITTVSPTYSREILQPAYGCGLDGVLGLRVRDLYGILNGIDEELWNPATDKMIPVNYARPTVGLKARNKAALKKSLGLYFSEIQEIPLIGMVSRLAEQKGFDLLLQQMDELMDMDLQLAILGDGDDRYRRMLLDAARRHHGKLSVDTAFSEARARFIYAGADMFLMPSFYEPCGLGQIIAMRYGAVPIVHRTGGLADTVAPWTEATPTGVGIVFNDYDTRALHWAVINALKLFQQKDTWRSIVDAALQQSFSWQESTKEYLKLYRKILRSGRKKEF